MPRLCRPTKEKSIFVSIDPSSSCETNEEIAIFISVFGEV